MKKLSNITESLWSDLQNKSLGTSVRKEDNIWVKKEEELDNAISHWGQVMPEYKGSFHTPHGYEVANDIIKNLIKEYGKYVPYRGPGKVSYHVIKFKNPITNAKLGTDLIGTKPSIEVRCDYFNKICLYHADNSGWGSEHLSSDILKEIFDKIKETVSDKKKVNESLWSDLQNKSLGKSIRKEDDVNHMNFDTFADYIEDNYSEKGNWFAVRTSEDGKSRHIEIEIISGITLSFNEVDGKIYNILIQSSNKYYADVPGLKKIFNVNVLGSNTFSVVEKDWTKSNNTFVKLIEFFLDKKTNESLWFDLQNKSLGKVVRKEDAFNPDYIDFGENTSVYWMTENLIIDGKSRFVFDDIKDYNNNGWRLPTVDEVKELNWDGVKIVWLGKKNTFRFPDGNEITLNFCNVTPANRLWTKNIYDKSPTAVWGYGLDMGNKFTLDPFNRQHNKLLVVLVKNKDRK